MTLICNHCSSANRSTAIFCKRCGKAVIAERSSADSSFVIFDDLDALVGLDELKSTLKKELTIAVLNKRLDPAAIIRNLDAILIGESGTGKTKIANIIARLLYKNSITKTEELTIIPAAEFNTFAAKLGPNLDRAKGGVIFIDHADQLVPEDYIPGQSTPLDKLYAEMDKRKTDPIIILGAKDSSFRKYLQGNQHANSRFYIKFFLPAYTFVQMVELSLSLLKKRRLTATTAFDQKLLARFNYLFKNQHQPSIIYFSGRNAFLVENEIDRIIGDFLIRSKGDINTPLSDLDITGEIFIPQTPDQVISSMNDLIGMAAVKSFMSGLVQKLEIQKRDSEISGKTINSGVHLVLTGNPGTGKTTLAEKLGELFAATGLLPSGHTISVTRADMVGQYIGETAKNVNRLCDEALGGVLFIDEAYMLKQDESDRFGQEAIDTLMTRMENDRGNFVMIAAGYREEMLRFIEANPGMKSRLNDNSFHLEDYTNEELFAILKVFCKKSGYSLTGEAEQKAYDIIRSKTKIKQKGFGNAREIRNLLDIALTNRARRIYEDVIDNRDLHILAEDLPGSDTDTSEKAVANTLLQINQLTGLKNVKKTITQLIDQVKANKLRQDAKIQSADFSMHFVFTGNPGTGKTTVARLVAKIFKALDILPTDKVIEVTAKDLVSGYMGQTGKLTSDIIDKAMGGVLFIDEAYTLEFKGNNQANYNSEAIDTLLKRMEDDRGKFIVVAAGYANEMSDFLESNPGLPSRFTHIINFEDYNAEELAKILKNIILEKGFQFEDNVDNRITLYAEKIYRNRGKHFGNARRMRTEADNILRNQGERILQQDAEGLSYNAGTITIADIPGMENDANQQQKIILALNKLNALTGLLSVKKEIGRMINFLTIEKLRSEQQGRQMDLLNNHFIFKGNPGTGKTTVARLLAEIFKAMGILEKGHLVETDRQKLVGQYIGHTEQLTDKVITSALGGVLFIDEAYTLTPKSGQSDFGLVAIETMLKRMEDERGNLIVIAAGYGADMDRFLSSNDGLASRFGKEILFEDYEPSELYQIFASMLESKGLSMSEEATVPVQHYFAQLYEARNSRFANGRTVRNIYEKSLERQGERLSGLRDEGQDVYAHLQTLILTDVIPSNIHNQ